MGVYLKREGGNTMVYYEIYNVQKKKNKDRPEVT
jgi:hypothetical protein